MSLKIPRWPCHWPKAKRPAARSAHPKVSKRCARFRNDEEQLYFTARLTWPMNSRHRHIFLASLSDRNEIRRRSHLLGTYASDATSKLGAFVLANARHVLTLNASASRLRRSHKKPARRILGPMPLAAFFFSFFFFLPLVASGT